MGKKTQSFTPLTKIKKTRSSSLKLQTSIIKTHNCTNLKMVEWINLAKWSFNKEKEKNKLSFKMLNRRLGIKIMMRLRWSFRITMMAKSTSSNRLIHHLLETFTLSSSKITSMSNDNINNNLTLLSACKSSSTKIYSNSFLNNTVPWTTMKTINKLTPANSHMRRYPFSSVLSSTGTSVNRINMRMKMDTSQPRK